MISTIGQKNKKAWFGFALSFLVAISLPFSVAHADTVPGENGKIAFVSNRDGNDEIYTMDADGSNQVNITNNPAGDNSPAWSPDGTKLVFTSGRDGNNEIYTMNADGSNVVRLTNSAGGEMDPSWSPDGTQIVFARSGSFGAELYTINADGTNEVAITNNFSDDLYPSWSPDGSRIAAYQYVAGTQSNIIVIDPDGSNEIHLPNVGSTASMFPSWSPDSTQIIFTNNRTGDSEIFVTDVDETDAANQVNLTNDPVANDEHSNWSPDGALITFQSDRTGNEDIFVMNSDGSNQVALTSNAADDISPVWQPQQVVPPTPPAPTPTPEPADQPSSDAEKLAETGASFPFAVAAGIVVITSSLALIVARRM